MAKLNKLYIDISAYTPRTIGQAFKSVTAYRVTQETVGTPSPDRYGNFLKDFAPITAGVDPATKPKNAVSAFYQAGGGDGPNQGAPFVAVDFIAATGNITLAPSIDPVTARNFRVRVMIQRLITAAEFERVTATGTLYVQRQHTIEV